MKFSRRFVIYCLKFVINGSAHTNVESPGCAVAGDINQTASPGLCDRVQQYDYDDLRVRRRLVFKLINGRRTPYGFSKTVKRKRGTKTNFKPMFVTLLRSLQKAQFQNRRRVLFFASEHSVSVPDERRTRVS